MTERGALQSRYDEVRRRTRQIFDLLAPGAFDLRPIVLRHPIRFYEGHLASFNFGMLEQSGFVKSDPQRELTQLFARGIDPLDAGTADRLSIRAWPEREGVAEYVAHVEGEMARAFSAGVDPLYLHTAVEHEEMHQETLIYLIHQLPAALKQPPDGVQSSHGKESPAFTWLKIDAGTAHLGAGREARFGWDNEFPAHSAEVAAFEIGSRKVSNGDFLGFVEAGGYDDARLWSEEAWQFIRADNLGAPSFWTRRSDAWEYLGLFETMPLPLDWPAYVSHAEALAYTRWCDCRLPTETEWHRAFDCSPAPEATRDNFDFTAWNPLPVGHGELSQLSGNGWEWTSTPFAGFSGFAPFAHYPGYSADFFDGRHFVLKGASPVTPAALVRPSFRNWFQDHYRHAYTAFRCARDHE